MAGDEMGSAGQKVWDVLCTPQGHQHRLAYIHEATGLTVGTVRKYVREWAAAGHVVFDSGVARVPKGSRLDAPRIILDCGGRMIYVGYDDEPEFTVIDRAKDSRNPTITRRRRNTPGPEGIVWRGTEFGTLPDKRPGETLSQYYARRDEEPAPIEGELEPAGAGLPAVREDADLPALLDAGARALAMATDNLERLRVRDHSRAVEAAARILKRTEVLVDASVLVQTAERAIVEAGPATPAADRGRGHASAVLGIDRKTLSKIRAAHAHVDDALFAGLVVGARESGEPLTRRLVARSGRDARGAPSPKVLHYSGDYERVSPPHIVEGARRVMGGIDLDPASREEANQVVKAERYFTEREDGLKRAWAGRVWLNPPFAATLVTAFVTRLIDHIESGRVTQAVLLTNNSTDTIWWQAAAAHALAVCLPAGRMRFLRPDLQPVGGSPLQGQALLYFGAVTGGGRERFNREFRRHGVVFYPVPQAPDE